MLTPADDENHIDKHAFKVPFVCGARDLGEALRRINEGAAMVRTKGEAGTGDIVEAVRHIRAVTSGIRALAAMRPDELFVAAKELGAPYELVVEVAVDGPAPGRELRRRRHRDARRRGPGDAARRRGRLRRLRHLQVEHPATTANAIVQATTHYDDPRIVAEVSRDLGSPMRGLELASVPVEERLAVRGW